MPTQYRPDTDVPSGGVTSQSSSPQPALAAEQALARYPSFEHVVELVRANRDVKLLVEIENTLRLAAYQPGRIEFVPTEAAPSDLAARLGSALQRWTGNRWAVTVVNQGGGETIAEIRDASKRALEEEASQHALVQAVMSSFPKARIIDIRTAQDVEQEAETEALPEVEDEWDPFEED